MQCIWSYNRLERFATKQTEGKFTKTRAHKYLCFHPGFEHNKVFIIQCVKQVLGRKLRQAQVWRINLRAYFRVVLAILCGLRNLECGLGNLEVWSTFDNIKALNLPSSCLTIITLQYSNYVLRWKSLQFCSNLVLFYFDDYFLRSLPAFFARKQCFQRAVAQVVSNTSQCARI